MGAVIILVIGGLLFAMLILPRQREMRRHRDVVDALSVGDEVMTGSGIYGTITELEGDLASLEIAPGVVIKLARRAIASTVTASDPAGETAPAREADPADETELATPDPATPDPVDRDADGLAG
jgi:preprotein translocase subunit YajC